jgi:transcriptional regulator with XRE-family HTH domain
VLHVTSLDSQIGENLARLRAPKMSQRALAEAMTEAGWKWSHVTVGSIERGERPLRASEAVGVADILDVPVEYLVDVQDAADLRKAQSAVFVALDRLQTAAAAWDAARLELAVTADAVGYEEPEVDGTANTLTALPLIAMTSRAAVEAQARERWWSDSVNGYLESKGDGHWVRVFAAAEEREHGEHPAEA